MKAFRLRMLLVVAILMCSEFNSALATSMKITVMPESSPTYSAGKDFGQLGLFSQSNDSLAPFYDESVSYIGWQSGGSLEQLDGAFLVYRFRLDFDTIVDLNSITVSGAAFNGPDSVMRLLDEKYSPLYALQTSGGNTYQTFTMHLSGITGRTFFLDEFDTSTIIRYRDGISVDYSDSSAMPEPASIVLLSVAIASFAGIRIKRRKK